MVAVVSIVRMDDAYRSSFCLSCDDSAGWLLSASNCALARVDDALALHRQLVDHGHARAARAGPVLERLPRILERARLLAGGHVGDAAEHVLVAVTDHQVQRALAARVDRLRDHLIDRHAGRVLLGRVGERRCGQLAADAAGVVVAAARIAAEAARHLVQAARHQDLRRVRGDRLHPGARERRGGQRAVRGRREPVRHVDAVVIEEHGQPLRRRRGLRGGLARREGLEEGQAQGDAAEPAQERAPLEVAPALALHQFAPRNMKAVVRVMSTIRSVTL